MTDPKKRPLDPAHFFLIAGMMLGLFYCVIIPYGAGFDEERHLARIYYISQYHFMPVFPNQTIHEDIFDLSYQRRYVQSPAFDMFSDEIFWKRFSRLEEDLRYGYKTQSIYSPVIFLPQALIGRVLWWKYDFPILPTILLQKLAGLLIYIAGAYIAIRIIPYGKWILTALALAPAAMYQAATLNADGFNTAVSFAFIGWVVAVYVNERMGVKRLSIWILAGLAVLLGLAKPGAIILLPLLLILIRHRFPSKIWVLLLIAGVLMAVVLNIGWWSLASEKSTFSDTGAQSVSHQSSQILADPMGFVKPLVQGMVLTFPNQIQGWIAAYGYGAGKVPNPVYFFSFIFMLAAFLAEPRHINIPTPTRAFMVGFSIFCSIGIYTIAFAANYATGGVLALAKHGRYYIPFAPLFFLGFAGLFVLRENLQRSMIQIAVISFALVNIYYSFGIYTTYYTYCGYDAYTGGKCTLPIYKNLEKEGVPEAVINSTTSINQTFTNFCGNLETVAVFVKSVPEDSGGNLRFSLLGEHHEILTSLEVPIHEISPNSYLELPVNLPTEYHGKQFEIRLDAPNLPDIKDEFRVTLTPANYYPGQLTLNGEVEESDLLIHYTCTTP